MSSSINLLEKKLSQDITRISSPLSIYTLMSMIYFGSDGKTKQELKKALNINMDEKNLLNYLHDIISITNQSNDKLMVSNNNCILLHDSCKLSSGFGNLFQFVNDNNGSIDHFNDIKVAISKTNEFVNTKTNGLIKKVLDSSDVNNMMRMILINVIYFKSTWKIKFDPSMTHEDIFTGLEKSRYVQYMHNTDHYLYDEDRYGQYLRIPYVDPKYSMIFALPRDTSNLNLDILNRNYTENKVRVKIPKFTLTYRTNLVQFFKDIGVTELFKGSANLSGMITNNEHVQVSNIFHDVVVKVDENGTEAAAVTTMIVSRSMMPSHEKEPIVFNADHIFKFVLFNSELNTVVFSGYYY